MTAFPVALKGLMAGHRPSACVSVCRSTTETCAEDAKGNNDKKGPWFQSEKETKQPRKLAIMQRT